jgi:hypothetical protein
MKRQEPKKQRKCFVMMPYMLDSIGVYVEVIKDTVESLGLICERADEACSTQAIIHDIVDAIKTADVCIADITGRNPNVYYEIALAHSYGKRTIIIGQDVAAPEHQVAFDIAHLRRIPYDPNSGDDWKYRLRERLTRMLTSAINAPMEQSMRFLAGEENPQSDGLPPSLEYTDKVIWHHSIHRRIANESLFYCLITIEPVYHRDLVVSCIEHAISSLGVNSYVLYETLGTTDLLLRAWLPKLAYERLQGNPIAVFQAEFQRQFGAARRLPGDPLPRLDTDSFQVIEIDGVWGHVLVDGTFKAPLDDSVVEAALHELSEQRIKQIESAQPTETFSRYLDDELIRKTVFSGTKMTFFIFITRPRDHASTYDNIFLGVLEQLTDSGRITNTSLLSTNHAKYGWILKGELASGDSIAVINAEIIRRINSDRFIAQQEIRTFTYPAMPIKLVEHLKPSASLAKPKTDVSELLRQEESPHFEVKGSLFVDIDFQVGKKGKDEKANIGQGMIDIIIKEIAGFLNGRETARILVGALEIKNYRSLEIADSSDIQSKRVQGIRDSPQVGNYYVVGLGLFEYDGKVNDYDKVERLLWERIRSKLVPQAAFHRISVELMKFFERDIMVITVSGRNAKQKPTYVDGQKFFVRRGSSTIQLIGPDMDEYEAGLAHR